MNGTVFNPVILPETEVPSDAVESLQEQCVYHRSRLIWGEGNPNASLMIVLDNPGARENGAGQPYVCGTRETLQRGLHEAGVSLEDVFVTYILKYRPTRAYDKKSARRNGIPYLKQQLSEVNPRILFCLGNVAVQAFFEDETKEVKALRGEWLDSITNSIDQAVRVSYHPLAVRRRPNLYPLFLQDCQAVADKLYL